MAKTKVTTACFSITGEYFTQITRELVLDGRWFFAFKMVREDLHGITWEQAMSVLAGTHKLTGDSNVGVNIVPEDPEDEDTIRYKRDMMWLYSAVYMPIGGEYPFKPYAIVTGYTRVDLGGPRYWRDAGIDTLRPDADNDDFKTRQERIGIKNWTGNDVYKRAMYYADDPMHDRAYMLKAQDPSMDELWKRDFAILFKPCYANTPFWIEPCATPQEAVDLTYACGGQLVITGNGKYKTMQDFEDDEEYGWAGMDREDEVIGCIGQDEKPVTGMTWSEGQEEKPDRDDHLRESLKDLMPAGLDNVANNVIDQILGTQDWTSVPKTCKHSESESGYVLRTGEFYPCGYMEHGPMANRILIHKYSVKDDIEDPQKEADKRGFVRLQRSAAEPVISVMCEKKPTKKQINAVFDHSMAHGPLEDYEKFMTDGGTCRINTRT